MKSAYLLIIVSLLCMALITWGIVCIHQQAQEFIFQAKQIQTLLLAQDLTYAVHEAQLLQTRWDELSPFWSLAVEHDMTDAVEEALIGLQSTLQTKSFAQAHLQASALVAALMAIDDALFPTWKNIL